MKATLHSFFGWWVIDTHNEFVGCLGPFTKKREALAWLNKINAKK